MLLDTEAECARAVVRFATVNTTSAAITTCSPYYPMILKSGILIETKYGGRLAVDVRVRGD